MESALSDGSPRAGAYEKGGSQTVESLSQLEESSVGSELRWTEAEERRMKWRMDLRIVPTLLILHLACFIDRANMGNARIAGMANDLELTGYRFNWALTLFYFSYIPVDIPSNILLKTIGGRYYLPSLVIAFGLISLCLAFVTDYNGLLVGRFFLGIAEGGMVPGIAYYLSCFYKRNEMNLRVSIYLNTAALAGAFGGLLAAGLTSVPRWGIDATPIHTWRNIFFFEGIMTMLIGIAALFTLPATPDTCKFLSPHERGIARERLAEGQKVMAEGKVTLKHVRVALCNINNIICGLGFFFGAISVNSFSLFLPTILQALGWTSLKTQFYTVPPYTVACFFTLLMSWLSDRYQRRGVFCMAGSLLAIVGYVIILKADSDKGKYAGVFVGMMGAFTLGPGFLTWGLNNAGGHSVRAVSSGYIMTIGNCGSIVASWTYLLQYAPSYKQGHYINIGAQCMCFLLSIVGIFYTTWENKKREAGRRDLRLEGLTESQAFELGYQHPKFRYIS